MTMTHESSNATTSTTTTNQTSTSSSFEAEQESSFELDHEGWEDEARLAEIASYAPVPPRSLWQRITGMFRSSQGDSYAQIDAMAKALVQEEGEEEREASHKDIASVMAQLKLLGEEGEEELFLYVFCGTLYLV